MNDALVAFFMPYSVQSYNVAFDAVSIMFYSSFSIVKNMELNAFILDMARIYNWDVRHRADSSKASDKKAVRSS